MNIHKIKESIQNQLHDQSYERFKKIDDAIQRIAYNKIINDSTYIEDRDMYNLLRSKKYNIVKYSNYNVGNTIVILKEGDVGIGCHSICVNNLDSFLIRDTGGEFDSRYRIDKNFFNEHELEQIEKFRKIQKEYSDIYYPISNKIYYAKNSAELSEIPEIAYMFENKKFNPDTKLKDLIELKVSNS